MNRSIESFELKKNSKDKQKKKTNLIKTHYHFKSFEWEKPTLVVGMKKAC